MLIAVPWTKREEALGEIEGWDDKIVIDAMNPYTEDFEIEDLGSKTSTEFTRALVPGARVVKAFNTIFYKRLATEGKPKGEKGRLAIPVASDDSAAKRVVIDLDRRDRVRPGRQRRAGRGRPQAAARVADLQRAHRREGDARAARPRLAPEPQRPGRSRNYSTSWCVGDPLFSGSWAS